jgi:hypothetical protein
MRKNASMVGWRSLRKAEQSFLNTCRRVDLRDDSLHVGKFEMCRRGGGDVDEDSKSPLNKCAPAAASRCDEADVGSQTSAWTCWLAARSARATAPPWEPVMPVTRKVWDWNSEMTLAWYKGD